MEITEFLAARLDEDEAAARDTLDNALMPWDQARQILYRAGWHSERAEAHIERWHPARVLAEVEAKRAIMAEHSDTHECSGPSGGLTFDPALQEDDWGGPCNTLCHFALPYAQHADYNPAWRP